MANQTTYPRTKTGAALTKAARIQLARDLRDELLGDWPTHRAGKILSGLSNKHFGEHNLFFPDLPATKVIPHCYEYPYPHWDYSFGEKMHNPESEPLADTELLKIWAESGIYPGE